MGIAIADRGNAREPQAGALFGLDDRAPLVWSVAKRRVQPLAAVAWVGFPVTTDILDANEADRGTAITGEHAQSMQRLIAAILEKGGR
jgi:hypothetical protein